MVLHSLSSFLCHNPGHHPWDSPLDGESQCYWFFLLENTYHGFFGPWFLLQPDWTIIKLGLLCLWSCFPSSWKEDPRQVYPCSLTTTLWSGINALAWTLQLIVVQKLWFLLLSIISSTRKIHMNSGYILITNLPHIIPSDSRLTHREKV